MSVAIGSLRGTFQALENRNYRWLWLGRLAVSAGFQMGAVVQGWLVFHLTGSAFALGWVSAGMGIATLLVSPYGGVIADRMDKRYLILWSRVGIMLSLLLIGVLISLDMIRVWHLAAVALLNGAFFAFLMPAQQSIISELVEPKVLMNAMSIDALGMGFMGVLSASVAGLLIEAAGPQGVYYVMVGMYFLSLYTLLKLPKTPPRKGERTSVWTDLRSGARYVAGQGTLLTILGLGLVRVLFVMPFMTLMPAFARNNLGFDAAGLGLLQSAVGMGALVASLAACRMGDFQSKGRLLVVSSAVLGLCLIAYVTVPWVPAVFLFLAVVGGLNNLYMVLNSTLLLSNAEPTYRGRVLSIAMMEFGLVPLGAVPAGAIADSVGVPWVISVQGVIVTMAFVLAGLLRPSIRKLK